MSVAMGIALLSAPLLRPHRPNAPACTYGNARRPSAPALQPLKALCAQLDQRRVLPRLAAAAVEEAPSAASEDDVPVDELKAQLLDSLFGTERGLAATSEVRAEINELITQLEGCNPNPSLDDAAALLDGCWKLVYASNSGVLALLGLGRLPGVTVGDITQTIESGNMTVENQARRLAVFDVSGFAIAASWHDMEVQLAGPFSRTALTTSASYELRSPKRLQVRFERGTVATPELLQDVELPTSVTVLGQPIDLTPVKEALKPVNSAARDVVAQLQRLLGQQPDLSFPITAAKAQTWLINTFLDEDTRVTRGDGGAVFVLIKDAPAPAPEPITAALDSPPPSEPEPEPPAPPAPPAPPTGQPLVEGPVSAAEGQGFDRTAGPVSGAYTERGAAEGQGFGDTAAAEGQGF